MPSIEIPFDVYTKLVEKGAGRELSAEQLANELINEGLRKLSHEAEKKSRRRKQ